LKRQSRIIEKTITKTLSHDLTDSEIANSQKYASKIFFEIEEKQEELKSISAEMRAEIKELKEKMRSLMDTIRKKAIEKQVECLVVYNFNRELVTVIRQDTGEVVENRPMQDHEKQMELGLEDQKPDDSQDEYNGPICKDCVYFIDLGNATNPGPYQCQVAINFKTEDVSIYSPDEETCTTDFKPIQADGFPTEPQEDAPEEGTNVEDAA